MSPGIRLSRLALRVFASGSGSGSGAGSGEASGDASAATSGDPFGLLPRSADGGELEETCVPVNGLRCAAAATARYMTTSATAAAAPSTLRLDPRVLDGGGPVAPEAADRKSVV